MNEDADRQRAVEANRRKQEARVGWGSSQTAARAYLTAVENQIEVLKDIRSTSGEGALKGNVSSGIEALERDAANISAEITSLPDK
jgi:hypothetical protein